MKLIADFHIHSKYSRAVSSRMNLEGLDEWAKIKGIDLIASGDFTHPQWLSEMKEKLAPFSTGVYSLKGSSFNSHFIISGEISLIYSKGGKVRKVHIVVLLPSIEDAEKLNKELERIGNLKADGRPILGLDAKEFLKIVLGVSKNALVIPAHVMTPWFGLYGSKSGFDSIEECFEELSDQIFAYETGLSADPSMLLKMKECRQRTLLSNSDSHSLEKIGREANVFDCELDYFSIMEKIKKNDLLYTIEFYPQEGKYFNDGHRSCGVNISPEESYKYGEVCPVCGKKLTIGVLNRTQKLSDINEAGGKFKSLVPLKEIISEVLGVGPASKAVNREYEKLIFEFGSEFNILIDQTIEDLEKINKNIAIGISKARSGDIEIIPGFDGEFGKINIFSKQEKQDQVRQKTLF